MGLLIKGAYFINPDNSIESGDVYIQDSIIQSIGYNLPVDSQDEVIYANNQLLTSGLVNCHTHVSMSLLRGIADDIPLKEWLEQEIWPREDKLTPEDIYWGAMLGIAEMIRGGTTAFIDMYFHEDEVAQAVLDSGIRACLSPGIIYKTVEQGEKALEESIRFTKNWNGKDNRVQTAFGPHALYTCPPEFLKRVAEEAKKLLSPIHFHFLETAWEREYSLKEYHLSPLELLRETGMLDLKLFLAHGVHINLEEAKELSKFPSFVLHNPTSNLKLSSGIAPVNDFLQAGLKVVLGTDGPASNNDLDMWEEGRLMSFVQKAVTGNPLALDASTTFNIMTQKGYEALGLKGGKVEVGYLADLIMIDLNSPRLTPLFNGYSQLVYNVHPDDVKSTIIGGKVVMKDRQLLTIKEEEIMNKAKKIARRIK